MSRHVTVWVGGIDVTADTLGQLEVEVGRSTFMDAPDAASLSLSMEWPSWAGIPVVGDGVQVLGWLPGDESTARALFAGHVTDVAWEGDVVSILAVDPSRRLDGVTVGDVPWPMESWGARVDRVLALARAALPEEAHWLTPRYGSALTPLWAAKVRVPWRDIDRTEVLSLLGELLEPVGLSWAFMPHMGGVGSDAHPADPGRWMPRMHFVELFPGNQPPPARAAGGMVGAHMIDADSPHRVAMNLGPVCNAWAVSGPIVTPDGKPVEGDGPTEWTAAEQLPDAARRRYGESSSSIDTGFAHDPANTYYEAPEWLARMWLDRTGYPTWAADGVLVPFDRPAMEAHPDDCDRLWRGLLAETPVGLVGQKVGLDGVLGTTDWLGRWVVEGLRLEWVEDGWLLEFTGLTDPACYLGAATAPPIDPRNTVSLAAPPPVSIGPGGFLLQPLLHDGGVQGAAGGWWRAVTLDAEGPVVANRGPGTLLPTPQLPPGRHTLVVQWLAHPDSTGPGHWLELPITVDVGQAWTDLPAGAWEDVPEDVTWANSDPWGG